MQFTPKLISAIAVLVIGFYVIGLFQKQLQRFFDRAEFDEALETFLHSFIGMLLKLILVVIAVTMLGVQTSSLVAVLGAATLAVGLALQGSLANFAGGVLILIFKPFRVGDMIEAQGVLGRVKKIEIFNTVLSSPDNKKFILPNGNLSNDVIINHTAADKRRLDLVVGIGYEDDMKKARDCIEEVLGGMDSVLQNEGSSVGVGNLGASSVDIEVRFWVPTSEYINARYEFTEAIKNKLDEEGVSIPYPQMDIHVNQSN